MIEQNINKKLRVPKKRKITKVRKKRMPKNSFKKYNFIVQILVKMKHILKKQRTDILQIE